MCVVGARPLNGLRTRGDPALERRRNDLEDIVIRKVVALGYRMWAWSG